MSDADKILFGPGGFKAPETLDDIPDAHYAAIGKVVDAWGDLEFEIDRMIWDLAGTTQPTGAAITSQLVSVYPKIDALIAILGYMDFPPETVSATKAFQGHVGSLVVRRNRTVHDKRFVYFDEATSPNGAVVRFEASAKSKLEFGVRIETIVELEQLRKEILEKIVEFNDLHEKIYPLLPALREKLLARLHRVKRVSSSLSTDPSTGLESPDPQEFGRK